MRRERKGEKGGERGRKGKGERPLGLLSFYQVHWAAVFLLGSLGCCISTRSTGLLHFYWGSTGQLYF